jgi:hypothetical protein
MYGIVNVIARKVPMSTEKQPYPVFPGCAVVTYWNQLLSNYFLVVDTMTSFGIDGNVAEQTSNVHSSC